MNTLTISGIVGRDPETRHTTGGKTVADFSIAISLGKKPDGSWKDSLWIKCVAWDKTAELVREQVRKKDRIVVTGRLDQESYTSTKDGTTKTALVCQINSFETLVARGEGGQQQSAPPQAQQRPASQPAQRPAGGSGPQTAGDPGYFDDDVPF